MSVVTTTLPIAASQAAYSSNPAAGKTTQSLSSNQSLNNISNQPATIVSLSKVGNDKVRSTSSRPNEKVDASYSADTSNKNADSQKQYENQKVNLTA